MGSYLISAIAFTVLSIPQIGLRESVMHCSSAMEPAVDRCLKDYTVVKQGSFNILLGHSHTKFNRIKRLNVGDRFRYGRKVYKIYYRKVVFPSEIWVMDRPKDEIALMTCAWGTRRRFVILARDVKSSRRIQGKISKKMDR